MRGFLIGSLHDFAQNANLSSLVSTENLTALVVSLAHYQEEGAKLAPEIYLCAQIEKLVRLIPNNQIVLLGQVENAGLAISLALKRGAPLAVDGWCIYVDAYAPHSYRYGVFRGSMSPLALNIEKSVLSTPISDCPVVRIIQVSPGCIEVRNASGIAHTIVFSDRQDEEVAPNAFFDDFVNEVCSQVSDDVRDPLKSYFANVLGRGLQESHGALLVVTSSEKMPKFLSDGITLQPPIGFASLVKNARKTAGALFAEQELIANAALLKGMIRSDGITVFSPKGSLLGYNCFIKPSQTAQNMPGGARTRAYYSLRTRIGNGLTAVFARSQDGMTKFDKRQ